MYWVIKIANILRYVIHSKTNILIKLYNSFFSKLFSVGEMSWSQSRIYVRWVILLWPFLRNISKNILNTSRLWDEFPDGNWSNLGIVNRIFSNLSYHKIRFPNRNPSSSEIPGSRIRLDYFSSARIIGISRGPAFCDGKFYV